MKKVIVVAAVSENGVYGEKGSIPWCIPEDVKHFKELTTGWTVVMGRGTWESLPLKFKPLPNRENFVITNTPGYSPNGAKVFASIEQAVSAASTEKVFCIGGIDIWYNALSFADEAWITKVMRHHVVTKDSRIALDLVNPSSRWPEFSLKESKKPEQMNDGIPLFRIRHWVREKRNN